MKLMILTAAVFPTVEAAMSRMPLLLASVKKYGTGLHFYGIGHPCFPWWCELKIKMQMDYLEANHADYTHVLYTDARDSFFTAPAETIIEKYEPHQNEILVSCCEADCHQIAGGLEAYGETDPKRFVYPHVGGYIGPIDLVIETKRKMWANSPGRIDDMLVWYEAWKEGYFRPARDLECKIFQVSERDSNEDHLEIKDGRLYNMATDQYPCILHLTGGYSRPDEGLSKPERLLPWWNRIHPDLA